MSYEIFADRSQTFLFPPSLDDWIPQNHPARFIAEFIESLDLQALGFEVGHAPTGRPSFSAQLLLSIICYCYFNRIRSLRKMERACFDNLGVIWLTGNKRPDFNTIGLFFRKNKKAIRQLLKESVQVAASANLVGMVLHAVDGTKIRAQASRQSGLFGKALENALRNVDKSIAEMEASIEQEDGPDQFALPDKLANAKARKQAIEEGLAELQKAGRKNLNPAEPDANVMQCDGKSEFGYNAQAVTDAKAGIVVASDVVSSENDQGLLTPMIDKVKDGIGSVAETTVADTQYSAGKDLSNSSKNHYNVLVNIAQNVFPDSQEKPFHISRFKYDEENKTCYCPLHKQLLFVGTRKGRESDGMLTIFRCEQSEDCPNRSQCSPGGRKRKVEFSEYRKFTEEQKNKLHDQLAQEQLRSRKWVVEPTFAFAKENLGFRKWSYRTMEAAQSQWALICTTINLLKLYKAWCRGNVRFA